MFRKILVANRGDVAVRVMRACRELGVETAAVYSEVDRNALHVRYADEAYLIGEGPARSSYLDISRIIEAGIRAGVDAIHPGYGFLAENPRFSQACAEAGIAFIGPEARIMRTLSDYPRLREVLRDAGIHAVPISRQRLGAANLKQVARQLGFPLLVKPAAGSGGRGERVVGSAEELEEVLQAASREAELAFGAGEVYLEREFPAVRRIEMHVMADGFGQIVLLGESEGTIRRARQKLIEEAPSPTIDAELRAQIAAVAHRVVQLTEYVGGGAVEFLLDESGQFYFSQMSPRLHVEHSVIEMVTGVDIVKEQIRIASGRKLRHRQEEIVTRGCAILCRIHAEDPYHDFRPSVGRVSRLIEPGGPGIRVESGVYEGVEVTHYYDPIIAKVTAWGEMRGEAILRLRRALNEYRIVGVQTSIPFLQQIMNRTSFIGGQFGASFDEDYFTMVKSNREELAGISAIAAALVAHQKRSRRPIPVQAGRKPSAWKVAGRLGEMGE